MPKAVLAAFLALIVANCGSTPKYQPPEGPGAFLQNRLVEVGNTRYFYFFEYAGNDSLEPTGINKSPTKSRAIFKTNSPYNETYKISPGPTIVGVRVVYVPRYSRNLFGRMNDHYYHVFVRNTGMTDEQIEYISDNIAEIQADDLRGMQGLEFVAVEGVTYQANGRIQGGRALVWIEDAAGAIVSPVVTAFGDGNDDVHGAWNEMFKANLVWPDSGLPDPRKGWGPSTNLPDPPN